MWLEWRPNGERKGEVECSCSVGHTGYFQLVVSRQFEIILSKSWAIKPSFIYGCQRKCDSNAEYSVFLPLNTLSLNVLGYYCILLYCEALSNQSTVFDRICKESILLHFRIYPVFFQIMNKYKGINIFSHLSVMVRLSAHPQVGSSLGPCGERFFSSIQQEAPCDYLPLSSVSIQALLCCPAHPCFYSQKVQTGHF